ncbi:hypothetical protein ACH4TQ_48320 [Streptomyces sp. NPDC021218]|uniref:hypothetical protein n=1 Tax=Streptomyces sp. NPDC021218 TaxID=3365119 RepID=UPI00378C5B84
MPSTPARLPEPLPGLGRGDVDVVINWGLGRDSSSIIARLLDDPAAHGIDLERTAVIHMATGDEWPDTIADAERFMLPLFRRHRLRLVQLARAGQAKAAGIEVLDDSRCPAGLVTRGSWTLWEEMESNGTVPQQAGTRLCSLHAKAEVGDRWIPAATGGGPFRQIIGFNADEPGRAEADAVMSKNPLRTAVFPLIEWGWGLKDCENYLFDRFGIWWKKSYCTFCCFPVSMGSLPAHLERMRAHPEIAGRVLRLEYTSMALNPNGRLFGKRSLLEHFSPADPASREVLDAFQRELDCPWAIYEVRRILPVSKADPTVRAPALRSVARLTIGTPSQTGRHLIKVSDKHDVPVEIDPAYGSVRAWLKKRGQGFPTVEHFLVAAPFFVKDKQQERFEREWAAHRGLGRPVFTSRV